jgi:signal transduction histidine kinase
MIFEKVKILYVDDEEHNLVAFRANFKRQYEIFTASSAEQALRLLEANPIFIIISDERMPQTSGVEFLELVANLYPDSVRLLITGHSDIDIVVQSINRGQVSKFIFKPWDYEKLALSIDHCITIYQSRLELKLKNEQLQKTNEELSKFAYSVSHDLRAPLTTILGVINLAKLNPEVRVADSYFNIIENRVEILDKFIKNIIDYFKNSRAQQVNEKINLNSFINRIWDDLNYEKREITLTVTIKEESVFCCDSFSLELILKNLISNAIKYQKPDEKNKSINIDATVDNKSIRMFLSDNGIGIGEENTENIFKLFFRENDSLNVGGTGIGLYLVTEAIEKIGGSIKLLPQVKVGATFELVIPNKVHYEKAN